MEDEWKVACSRNQISENKISKKEGTRNAERKKERKKAGIMSRVNEKAKSARRSKEIWE
jgi:hypothetical protein